MASVRRPLIWNRYVVEVKYCHWYISIRKRAGEKNLFSKTRIMQTKIITLAEEPLKFKILTTSLVELCDCICAVEK